MNDSDISDIKDREIDNIKKSLKATGVIIGIVYAFFLYDTDDIVLRIFVAIFFYVFSLLLWSISVLIDILARIERNNQNKNIP